MNSKNENFPLMEKFAAGGNVKSLGSGAVDPGNSASQRKVEKRTKASNVASGYTLLGTGYVEDLGKGAGTVEKTSIRGRQTKSAEHV